MTAPTRSATASAAAPATAGTAICRSFTGAGVDAAAGARRHWCFKAPSRAAVDAFHAAGLAHGGRDEGAPGLREHYHSHYYAAFLLDPAGNRIEAVCHDPA